MTLPLLSLVALSAVAFPAQTPSAAPEEESLPRCGVLGVPPPPVSDAAGDGNPNSDPTLPGYACGLWRTVIDPRNDPPATAPDRAPDVLEIPVVFHLIEHSDGTRGVLPDELVHAQIRVLNEDFRALAGTRGGAGVDTGIEFVLATRDPDGNPATGITRTVRDDWFAWDGIEQYGDFLLWDPHRYLNVVSNDGGGNLGVVLFYPQQGVVGTGQDYVVLRWTTVGRPARTGLGRTLTHEIGHYLGLRHVFEMGCFEQWGLPCSEFGDLICDTNPVETPTFNCPASRTSCGLPAPYRNYMDYSSDGCVREFSPEQVNRMRCTLVNWRPDLYRVRHGGSHDAAAVPRNAGNPDVYWATPPWIGEEMQLFVNAGTNSVATIAGFGTPAERPHPAGTLLVETAGAPAFLASVPGRLAFLRVPIPPQPVLIGKRLYTQALLHGGDVARLSNAVDLAIGVRAGDAP